MRKRGQERGSLGMNSENIKISYLYFSISAVVEIRLTYVDWSHCTIPILFFPFRTRILDPFTSFSCKHFQMIFPLPLFPIYQCSKHFLNKVRNTLPCFLCISSAAPGPMSWVCSIFPWLQPHWSLINMPSTSGIWYILLWENGLLFLLFLTSFFSGSFHSDFALELFC